MGRLRRPAERLQAPPRRIKPPVKKAEPFYLSRPWRDLVASIKRTRGARCQDCGATGVRLIGDHVIERRDGGGDLDADNVRLMCWPCHNRKTAKAKARRAGR